MSLYTDYLSEIETRKKDGLKPKPIEDGKLLKEIISQIKDTKNNHRKESINFLIYNTIPGTPSAAVEKSKFLKEIILENVKVDYLDGSNSVPNRHEKVHAFQNGLFDTFLISLKGFDLIFNFKFFYF